MSESEDTLRLRIPVASRMRRTFAFAVAVLTIVATLFVLTDRSPLGSGGGDIAIGWLFAPTVSVFVIGSSAAWGWMLLRMSRANILVANGRIRGTLMDATKVDFSVRDVAKLGVKRSRGGRVVALTLQHDYQDTVLAGFMDLESGLEAITRSMPESLPIEEDGLGFSIDTPESLRAAFTIGLCVAVGLFLHGGARGPYALLLVLGLLIWRAMILVLYPEKRWERWAGLFLLAMLILVGASGGALYLFQIFPWPF
jgi:hypothetical protein